MDVTQVIFPLPFRSLVIYIAVPTALVPPNMESGVRYMTRLQAKIHRSFRELEELHSELVINHGRPGCSLEDLPSELRCHLLLMLNLEDMKNLVAASPVFHQQYLLDRRFILLNYLDMSLRSVAIDAVSTYCSGTSRFANKRTTKSVSQFLLSYKGQRDKASSYCITKDNLTVDEAVDMVRFHARVVLPVMELFVDRAFKNFPNTDEPTEKNTVQQKTLSATEEIRIFRALYRHQIACNLFAPGREKKLKFPAIKILEQCLSLYEPWEVEEMACIYTLARDYYDVDCGFVSVLLDDASVESSSDDEATQGKPRSDF
jgi:hypothetical protein